MRKIYKNFITPLVTLCLLCFAMPVSALDTYNEDGINYAVTEANTAMVYGAASTGIAGDVVIPASVTLNGKQYTVTDINGTAFKDCVNITSVNLPATITTIDVQAFNGCKGMKTINLENTKIKNLATSTFLYCSSLESITLPVTVEQCGINPFMEDLALKEIKVADGNKNFTSIDGVLFSADKKTLVAFAPASTLNYVVPEGTEIIANSAFCMSRRLKTIKFPVSLKTIDSNAFLRIDDLQLIELPPALETLGTSAFAECTKAEGEIILPSTLKKLSNKSFYYTRISKLEIPGTIPSIPTDVARYCVNLRTIILHEGTTVIYGGAFNTTAISSIVIPNSITRIRESVFQGCSLLKSITLGSGLKTIDTQVFYKLTGISEINVLAVTPPTVTNYPNYPAFTDQVYSSCKVNVPAESIEAYKAAEVWKNFTSLNTVSINEIENNNVALQKNGNSIIVLGNDGASIQVYNMSGSLVYQGNDHNIALPGAGVYVVKVGKQTFKVAI